MVASHFKGQQHENWKKDDFSQEIKRLTLEESERVNPAHEVKRFQLSELTNKLNCLSKSLLVAVYMELELFEYAFLLLVLGSYEFKMLLVTLAQY